jgi:hypothetical protein
MRSKKTIAQFPKLMQYKVVAYSNRQNRRVTIRQDSGESRYCGVRCETATRVAKLAPNTERLAGSVAPKRMTVEGKPRIG